MAERVSGTVVSYINRKGCGHIKQDGETEKIFVHWKAIQSEASWPSLKEGMEVEFEIEDGKKGKQCVNVTLVGGESIGAIDDDTKKYNMDKKYSGTVKFYDIGKGFGFITPEDDTIEWDGKSVDKESGVHVSREDIITDREPPALDQDEPVEFNVYSGEGKTLGAGKIVSPGQDMYEYKDMNRKFELKSNEGKNYNMEKKYTGKVKFFDVGKGFGFIVPDEDDIEWDGKTVTKESGLHVSREDIVTDRNPPALDEDDEALVEFNVYSSDGASLGAGKITTPGQESYEYRGKNKKRHTNIRMRRSNKKVKSN